MRLWYLISGGGPGFFRSVALYCGFLALLIVGDAVAQESSRFDFEIPSQGAGEALTEFAQQTNIPILFPYDEVSQAMANDLIGEYGVEEGLRILLSGTGLSATVSSDGQVVVRVRDSGEETNTMNTRNSNQGSRNFLQRMGSAIAAAIIGAAPANAPAQQRSAALEEIVVSARRVEESLQEVPVSVAVFTGEDLAIRGLTRGEDLINMVPNVVIGGGNISTNAPNMTIRGMPNVGIYVDGVAQNSTGLLQQGLVEMERVEVLRGPQGTLFGRNSNGGAIQMITKRPAPDFGTRIRAEIGEYNRQDLSASVDLPLRDNLLSKFTVGQYQMDGQVCSLSVPECYGGRDDSLLRADFLWTASENFDLRVSLDSQRTTSSDRRQTIMVDQFHQRIAAVNVAAQNPAFRNQWLPLTEYTPRTHNPGYPGGEVGNWQTKGDGPSDGIKNDYDALTVTFNWDISDTISLESISAWWLKEQQAYKDIRGAEVIEGVEDLAYTRDKVWSQEFHLAGAALDTRLTWLAGLWYQGSENWEAQYRWNQPWARSPDGPDANCQPDVIQAVQDYVRDPANWVTPYADYSNSNLANWVPQNIPPSQCFGGPLRDKTTDYAIFGEISYAFTDRLDGSFGVRWSDRTHSNYQYTRFLPDPDPVTGDPVLIPGTANRPDYPVYAVIGDPFLASVTTESRDPNSKIWFTPRLSLDYQWTDDVMVYASYSEGFTAAEVNFVSSINDFVEVDPELVKTMEFGIHSDWLDGTLRLNASLFFTDWENIRTETRAPDPDNPGQFLLGPVQVTGGTAEASGLDAEFVWRPNERWYITGAVGMLDTKYIELLPGVPIQPGQKFPFAPDFSYNVAAERSFFLGNGGSLTVRGDYRFMDDYVTHPRDEAQLPQEGFGISSARVTYEPASSAWTAYFYGTNLGNVKYFTSGFIGGSGGLFFSQVGMPRQYGAGFTFTFE
jgi:iron complex outermembrane receptor protein